MTTGRPLIECVPNFSEGRNKNVIRQIAGAIESVAGVSLLNVDPGQAANRTVMTFVGEPGAVCEAAFRAVKKAGQLIDLRHHQGTHPRMGATDVLPLVPIRDISLDECAELARALARRIADELLIPCYGYEAAALRPTRKNLAVCRAGGYEALEEKMTKPGKEPDFLSEKLRAADGSGRVILDADSPVWRTGCTAVGARNYLIAVNFNLNTTSVPLANEIAYTVREKGKAVQGANGETVWKPGRLKSVKALGWFIDEYGIAQVSTNLTDIGVTPLHIAFNEVSRVANERGLRVTGTEIIGLLPLKALVDAGKFFLEKQGQPADASEDKLVLTAIKAMGLDELRPFNPREKVIEYLLEDAD